MRRGRPSLVGTMARTAVIAGTATAVSGAVAGSQQQKAQAQAATAQQSQQQLAEMQQQMAALQAQQAQADVAVQAAGAGGDDVLAKVKNLAELNASGVLTDQQFAEAVRNMLLAG
jgi:hypothetical protein